MSDVTTPSVPDSSGSIVFFESRLPALLAGEYTVTVEHTLQNTDPAAQSPGDQAHIDKTFAVTRRFAVRGPRFSLDPSAIHSVFPPDRSRGEFTDVLAHVVLTNPTMAWQRTADGVDGTPWLALLAFHPSDGIGDARSACVGDLERADFAADPKSTEMRASTLPPTTVSYPNLKLDLGESSSDPCRVIDVPVETFSAIAPALADLRWLAHARTVASATSVDDDGGYSVVVTNRLPVRNTDCTVHLVSFEDMAGYLPKIAADGTYRPVAIAVADGPANGQPATAIRLVSLRSWTFRPVEPTETFDGYLAHVSRGPLQRSVAAASSTTAGAAVDKAFDLGYTALDHHTRLGDRTVSWVRGPLLPYAGDGTIASLTNSTLAADGGPIDVADEAMRYDPATGMFDATYAAAWQIGRLLALQNTSFAQALYDWKRATARSTIRAIELELLSEQFGPVAPAFANATHGLAALHAAMGLVASHVVPAICAPGDAKEAAVSLPLRPKTALAERYRALMNDAARLAAMHQDNDPPDAVVAWLQRLRKLYGVPFNYLVPDEAMLPAESIRFFRVDPNWILALLEGAFSLGSSTAGDAAHDAAVRPQWHAAATPTAPMSGLLLRSGAVAHWPTLQVRALDANGQALNPIRVERLSSSVLLALFTGTIATADMTEPPIGLHFGVMADKPLRYVTVPPGAPPHSDPGTVMGGSSSGPVPLRPDNLTVAISAYAAAVKAALEGELQEAGPGGTTTQVHGRRVLVATRRRRAAVPLHERGRHGRFCVDGHGRTRMSAHLVVPIDVQAFCVGRLDIDPNNPYATSTFARLSPDFSNLPTPAEIKPNLSELVRPVPFASVSPQDALGMGVHLHWALPDALVQGRGDPTGNGTVEFPEVPNRWLVARILVDAAATPPTAATKGSIVESDRAWDADFPTGRDAASRTALIASDSNAPRPYTRVGRVFDLASWREDPSGMFLATTNALGYGDTAYAATYEQSTNVFTFHDDLSDTDPAAQASGLTLAYVVVGWFSNLRDDPVATLAATTPEQFVAALKDSYRWTVAPGSDIPGAMVCTGLVDGMVWSPTTTYVGGPEGDPPLTVAIGNNRIEALSAWLAAQPGLSGMANIERLLEVVQAGLLADWTSDLVSVEEHLHEHQFAPCKGGSMWQIESERVDPTAGAAPTVLRPPPALPARLATLLNELNRSQAAVNRADDEIVSRRQQVFADWTKYIQLSYWLADTSGRPAIDADEAQDYITAAIGELAAQITQRETVLAPAVQAKKDAVDAELKKISDDKATSIKLVGVQVDAPRYWVPTDPVVLIAGDLATPPIRHGGDGDYHAQGLLECRTTATLTTSLSILALNGVTVGIRASDLPGLANLPDRIGDGLRATLQAIIGEAMLTLPANAPVVVGVFAARAPGTDVSGLAYRVATADRAWLESFTLMTPASPSRMPSRPPEITRTPLEAGVSFSGTAPSPVGYNRWIRNPWIPLILQWDVRLTPQVPVDGVTAYAASFLTDGYRLEDDGIDLVPASSPAAVEPQGYQGTVGLSGRLEINLQNQITKYLASYPGDSIGPELSQALSSLAKVKVPMMAQALGGLREAFRMRHRILQLPVYDPYEAWSGPGATFSNTAVHNAVGSENASASIPVGSYNPITAGYLWVYRLRLVDAFGQVRDINVKNQPPIRSSSLRPTTDVLAGHPALLRPRFAQPARLSFQWLSADDDEIETNSAPASSPICGWMLFNHLDGSLMIYDQAGSALGAFSTRGQFWQGAPGNDESYLRLIADVFASTNRHLRNVALAISGAASPAAFLDDLLRVIDDTATLIEPPNARQHRTTSVLFGQPLAIVRAQVGLELQGLATIDESWAAFDHAIKSGARQTSRSDARFPDVEVPVRLGDVTNLSDGLIGYFIDDGSPGAFQTFYAAAAAAGATAGVVTPARKPVAVTSRDGSKPVTLTMLIDPRAEVHATTGLLPVTSISIDPSMYSDALRRMSVVFLVAPLATSARRHVVPLPVEAGASWSWVSETADGWEVTPEIASPNPADAFSDLPQRLVEGWVKLTPDPPKTPERAER